MFHFNAMVTQKLNKSINYKERLSRKTNKTLKMNVELMETYNEYLLFKSKSLKKRQEIISFLKNKNSSLYNVDSKFYIGFYKNKDLWLSINIVFDCKDCFETALLSGSETSFELTYDNDLGYPDIKRFFSKNEVPYDNDHFEQVYNEFERLRNIVNYKGCTC